MRRLSLSVFGLSLAVAVLAWAREARPQAKDAGENLHDAVAQFNAEAASNPIGAKQPPLTEDEVVAAIRGWVRNEVKVDDRTYAIYEKIASTGKLPKEASLGHTTGWGPFNGYDFTVWWVDLNVMTGKTTGYTFRIRSRLINSEPTNSNGPLFRPASK